ncbi:MAG: transglycosylase domain-containing protein, partial [Clostridia bacterium]|nr:transglycosylase domain-containing protein [Clostridia bacterium]
MHENQTPQTGHNDPQIPPVTPPDRGNGQTPSAVSTGDTAAAKIQDRTHTAEQPAAAASGPEPKKKVYVNAPPRVREKDENRIRWGAELLHAGAIAGQVILRILSWVFNILITVALIGMITGTIVGGVFALWIKNYVDPTIDSSLLTTSQDLTTQLYYMDYSEDPLGVPVEIEDQRLHSTENRLWVAYTELPQDLVDAFIAVEDHRFWKHSGVDWYATIGATFKYLTGTGSRGGSTITQQLVKNITQDDDVTIQRKVQEIFRALNLEK